MWYYRFWKSSLSLEGLEQTAQNLAIDGVMYEDTVDTGLVKHGIGGGKKGEADADSRERGTGSSGLVKHGTGGGEKGGTDADSRGRGSSSSGGVRSPTTTTEWGSGEESVEGTVNHLYSFCDLFLCVSVFIVLLKLLNLCSKFLGADVSAFVPFCPAQFVTNCLHLYCFV